MGTVGNAVGTVGNGWERVGMVGNVDRTQGSNPPLPCGAAPGARATPGTRTTHNYVIVAAGLLVQDCIQRWLKTRSACPLCNREWVSAGAASGMQREQQHWPVPAQDAGLSIACEHPAAGNMCRTPGIKSMPIPTTTHVQAPFASRLHRSSPRSSASWAAPPTRSESTNKWAAAAWLPHCGGHAALRRDTMDSANFHDSHAPLPLQYRMHM